jgi:hypothetical protein
MAIGTITRFPQGVGAEQYDAVTGQMRLADEPPEGLIFHSAGELDDRFQVFNVWESREHFDRFTRERLRPAAYANAATGLGLKVATGTTAFSSVPVPPAP